MTSSDITKDGREIVQLRQKKSSSSSSAVSGDGVSVMSEDVRGEGVKMRSEGGRRNRQSVVVDTADNRPDIQVR